MSEFTPSSSSSAASINAGEANVDDKAPLWIFTNKIEKLPGGGSWRFQCKFCNNQYVGSHGRVATHLLKDGGKGIKTFLKVTSAQQANISKLWNDCKERVKNTAHRLPSSSRKASSSSLNYDMLYSVPTPSESDPKKRKGMGTALEKAWKNNAREQCDEWLAEDSTRKASHQDIDITRERKNCILKYYGDVDQRREVNVEYSNFSLCMEDFCNVDAMRDRSILDHLRWWAVHGASAPILQALAFKLLGQPSSSSCCERNWSTYKFIHSATRNKITPQRAEDLVFVHTNLRLLARRKDSYKEGPSQMWDLGGDQFDSLDESNLGRLEFEDLFVDEPSLEGILFDNVHEGEDVDDDDLDVDDHDV
ncbi:hypothetical protein ACLB2K_053109 [Fragaria x ananassa]